MWIVDDAQTAVPPVRCDALHAESVRSRCIQYAHGLGEARGGKAVEKVNGVTGVCHVQYRRTESVGDGRLYVRVYGYTTPHFHARLAWDTRCRSDQVARTGMTSGGHGAGVF